MKRIAFALSLALAARAFSWSPATHMHLAERATGSSRPEVHFGSMLPDMNNMIVDNPAVSNALRRLSHYESDRLAPSCLALGVLTHNDEWGADWYAHQHWLPDTPESAGLYSTIKVRHLEAALGVNPDHAEFLFEFAIDYLLRVDEGTALGMKMWASAAAFRPPEQQWLVDAFAAPLAERVPERSLGEAKADLRNAASLYRYVTAVYATALVQDDAAVLHALASLTALYLGINRPTAAAHLSYAIALCRDDYRAELNRIAELLRADIAVHAPEAIAACSWGCAGPTGPTAPAAQDPWVAVSVAIGIAWAATTSGPARRRSKEARRRKYDNAP